LAKSTATVTKTDRVSNATITATATSTESVEEVEDGNFIGAPIRPA